jgi:uncharacterized protein YecT (DUF1311 family)
MKTFSLALALLCVSAPALHAQLDDTDPQYRAVCREALAKPFTPPVTDPNLKPDCDSTVAYFGIGQAVDYKAALACAAVEYTHPDPAANPSNPFPGAGILSMIYANGQGTAQNLDLATRYTCENWAAPSEIEARLDLLAAARETPSAQPLDLCDTADSANTRDWCTSIEARQSAAERNRGFDALRATLPEAARVPFNDLLAAEKDFEDGHIQNELDLTGATPIFAGFHTAEKTFQITHIFDRPAPDAAAPAPPVAAPPFLSSAQLEEQNDLADRFLEDLKRITAPSFAETTDLKKAEKSLDASLKTARVAIPKKLAGTTITYKGVEDTQQIWLNLRDHWRAFISLTNASPTIADQTASYVTLERSRQLSELIANPR